MISRYVRNRSVAIGSAAAASVLLTLAASSPASADATRTLNLSFTCATGEPYGLQVNTGSGFYMPNGSSYAVGATKYFTVTISASASTLTFMPYSCENEPTGGTGPVEGGYATSIIPGTSTITTTGYCEDYNYNWGGWAPALIFDCTLSSVSYG
jgi:hypothetical protein